MGWKILTDRMGHQISRFNPKFYVKKIIFSRVSLILESNLPRMVIVLSLEQFLTFLHKFIASLLQDLRNIVLLSKK